MGDAARELAILEDAEAQAPKFGLSAVVATTFVQLQADCCKQLEEFWLEHWGAAAPPPRLSLADLRVRLSGLNAAIFSAWQEAVQEWSMVGGQCSSTHIALLFATHFVVNGTCGGP